MVAQMFRNLCSFEFFFVAFLVSGTFKSAAVFSAVPIDLTLFFFLLSVLAAAGIAYRGVTCSNSGGGAGLQGPAGLWKSVGGVLSANKQVALALGILGALVAWSLVTLAFSPGSAYALNKVLRLALFTGWAFGGTALVVAKDNRRAQRFLFLLAAYGLVLAAAALGQYVMRGGGLGMVKVWGNDYISLGRVVGAAGIIAFVWFLFARDRWVRVFWTILFSVLLITLFISGARGPFLAGAGTALVFVLIAAYCFKTIPYRLNLLVAVSVIIVMVLSAYGLGMLDTTLGRIDLIFEQPDMGASADIRLELFREALHMWTQNPVTGVGAGGFPVLLGYGDVRVYPHNLVLEVLAEFGLIGFILLAGFFYSCFRMLPRIRVIMNEPVLTAATLLFLYALLNAMVSGGINDNRVLFAFAGLFRAGVNYAAVPGKTGVGEHG